MKIALINGSPKAINSTSNFLLKMLKEKLEPSNPILVEYHFSKTVPDLIPFEKLTSCDALVFAFPLYMDGIPSHLLHCLRLLQTSLQENKKKTRLVYTIINCGFYESSQTKVALEIMENWCAKSRLTWGQGTGIGGGPMFLSLQSAPIGQGSKKILDEALNAMTYNLLKHQSGENQFISPNIPSSAYKMAAEAGWRKAIKANGLKRKDLSLKK